jgi:hypothetical protein
VACSKAEHDITTGVAETKILAFLNASPGKWFATGDVASGAKVRKETVGPVLDRLNSESRIAFCTGQTAHLLGYNARAKLWAIDAQHAQPGEDARCSGGTTRGRAWNQ